MCPANWSGSDAKARDTRLRDGRHTAATVLLILGVPERVVMQIMVAHGDGGPAGSEGAR